MIDKLTWYGPWPHLHRGLKHYRCSVPCQIGETVFTIMSEAVGEIRERKDGRWDYFIKPSQTKGNPRIQAKECKQGTVATEEEARRIIEANYV